MNVDLGEAIAAFQIAKGTRLSGPALLRAVIDAGRYVHELDRQPGTSSNELTSLQQAEKKAEVSRQTLYNYRDAFYAACFPATEENVYVEDPRRLDEFVLKCEVDRRRVTAKGFKSFYGLKRKSSRLRPEELKPKTTISIRLPDKDFLRIDFERKQLGHDWQTVVGKGIEVLRREYQDVNSERSAA